jgi:hypothetical protein
MADREQLAEQPMVWLELLQNDTPDRMDCLQCCL